MLVDRNSRKGTLRRNNLLPEATVPNTDIRHIDVTIRSTPKPNCATHPKPEVLHTARLVWRCASAQGPHHKTHQSEKTLKLVTPASNLSRDSSNDATLAMPSLSPQVAIWVQKERNTQKAAYFSKSNLTSTKSSSKLTMQTLSTVFLEHSSPPSCLTTAVQNLRGDTLPTDMRTTQSSTFSTRPTTSSHS
jgi:hypothetical protein